MTSSRTTTQQANLSGLQAYNVHLFKTAIHPEFFEIAQRTEAITDCYESELLLMRGGHAIRFECDGVCVTEVLFSSENNFPGRQQAVILPCASERDHEQTFASRINCIVSIQSEILSGHLFMDSYSELIEHAGASKVLMTEWDDENGHYLSVVEHQKHRDQLHVQGYQLASHEGAILRTQTIFEITKKEHQEN